MNLQKITSKLKNTFVRYNSANWESLQKAMFKMGFHWAHHNKGTPRKILSLVYDEGKIFINSDCVMTFSTSDYGPIYSENRNNKEVPVADIYIASVKFVSEKKCLYKEKRKAKQLANILQTTVNTCGDTALNKTVLDKIISLGHPEGKTEWYDKIIDEAQWISIHTATVTYSSTDVNFWPSYRQLSIEEIAPGFLKSKRKESSIIDFKFVSDGNWIEHDGNKCPVPEGTIVEIEYRDGTTFAGPALTRGKTPNAEWAYWDHDGWKKDIVKYRIPVLKHEEEVEHGENIEHPPAVLHEVVSLPIGVTFPKTTASENVEAFKEMVANMSTPMPDTNPKRQYGIASIPLNLWPSLASAYGSLGLYNGALKYGKNNFKATPVEASIYIAGAMRHLAAWAEGEEFDPVDGVPNLGGALANIAIILEARAQGTLIDDRNIGEGYLKERAALMEIIKHLNELHKDKNPKHYTRNTI